MEAIAQNFYHEEPERSKLCANETTFYDLVEAINEEISPEEDWLTVEVVLNLFKTKQIRFLSSS